MKKFMVLVMGLVSLGAMAGCDDDSKSVKVPAAVQAAFGEMFPAASHVEWEDKGGYMVADFRSAGMYMQAWFDAAGKWYMTEEDISYAELPRAVRTAYEAGDYAAWHVDDVDKLLRNGQETVYVLEVERAEQEFDLYYSEDGVLLREVPDRDGNDDHGDMLPQELSKAISDFIARKYPGPVSLMRSGRREIPRSISSSPGKRSRCASVRATPGCGRKPECVFRRFRTW